MTLTTYILLFQDFNGTNSCRLSTEILEYGKWKICRALFNLDEDILLMTLLQPLLHNIICKTKFVYLGQNSHQNNIYFNFHQSIKHGSKDSG